MMRRLAKERTRTYARKLKQHARIRTDDFFILFLKQRWKNIYVTLTFMLSLCVQINDEYISNSSFSNHGRVLKALAMLTVSFKYFAG